MAREANGLVRFNLLTVLLLGVGLWTSTVSAAEEAQDVPWETAYRHAADSFVVVQYHLKKSDRPRGGDNDSPGAEPREVLARILDKSVMEAVGVIVSEAGEVLTSERQPQLSDVVVRITVQGRDGVVVPAEADRLLTKAPGRILRIAGPMPKAWHALSFGRPMDASTRTATLFAITMEMGEPHRLQVGPCRYALDWQNAATGDHGLQVPNFSHVGVLCDGTGQPIGVTALREIDLGPDGPVWLGQDILADPGISADEQRRLEEALEKEFAENIYEITVTFRPDSREDGSGGYHRYYAYDGPYARDQGQERVLYGLGFTQDQLLVPEVLPAETVAGIDTITVNVGDQGISARFGGVLKGCALTVIELEEGKLPHTAAFAVDATLARIEPFWGVSAREMAGKEVRAQYVRWISKREGYANEWHPVSDRPLPVGTWLINRHGRLVGLCGTVRHELDRLRPYLLGDRYGAYRGLSYYASEYMGGGMPYGPYRGGSSTRLFEAGELVRMLDDLPADYDPHIRHMTRDEQKRRVWLGVEYTALSKEMVEQMGLRRPTEDGRLGMMINRVYLESPAARQGLTEGDILLTIAVPQAPWPIELTIDEWEHRDMPDFAEADIPKEFEAMGLRMPRRRPWPSRANSLTRMLDDIGLGTPITVRYIHGGDVLEKEFVIEQAPRDMLSAAKYKNEKLGLTVKDLTYEVRAALHLDEDVKAVVTTDVEQGTAAALARINPYELIRAVDGETVGDVEAFERLIAEAQEAGKESVRLTVETMGKTRLADLRFDAKGSPSLLKTLLPGLP